jgi:hypothetical protein
MLGLSRPLEDQQRQHDHTQNGGADKSAAPAEMTLHGKERRRRYG